MIVDNRLADFRWYAKSVRSGEVVACRQVKEAVERYYRDIERQSTPGFPYYFDEETAADVIDWYPKNLRHTIGKFATHRFVLEPWQQFGIGNIYGWKRVEDGTRRFRRVFWTMGRKNGKSTLAAGMSIYAAGFDILPATGKPEEVAQVILAATKEDQAKKITFAEIRRMTETCEQLVIRTEFKHQEVRFIENNGQIMTTGTRQSFHGLNPTLVMLDEIHEWRHTHSDYYDSMLTASGSRDQPLTICTTTAGDNNSHIWLSEYEYAKDVVNQTIEDETWFAFIFQVDPEDDPLEESVWIKANPNLEVSLKTEYLRENARRAIRSKVDFNRFLRFHANRMVSSTAAAFDMDQWDACNGELSDWNTADAIGAGVDIGGRDDLAALGFVAKFRIERDVPFFENEEQYDDWMIEQEKNPLYRYEIRAQAYIAVDTSRDLTVAPFADWVHTDLIKRCELPLVQLTDDLIQETDRLYISSVAYDPAGGQLFAEQVSQNTGVEVASMAQNYTHFHEPIQDFRQAMADGRLRHDGNPVLKWCLGNAVSIKDPQDREMFCKRDSSEKIDLAVGVLMAYRRAMLAPARGQGALYIT